MVTVSLLKKRMRNGFSSIFIPLRFLHKVIEILSDELVNFLSIQYIFCIYFLISLLLLQYICIFRIDAFNTCWLSSMSMIKKKIKGVNCNYKRIIRKKIRWFKLAKNDELKRIIKAVPLMDDEGGIQMGKILACTPIQVQVITLFNLIMQW